MRPLSALCISQKYPNISSDQTSISIFGDCDQGVGLDLLFSAGHLTKIPDLRGFEVAGVEGADDLASDFVSAYPGLLRHLSPIDLQVLFDRRDRRAWGVLGDGGVRLCGDHLALSKNGRFLEGLAADLRRG